MPQMSPIAFNNPYFQLGVKKKLAEGVFGQMETIQGKGLYIYSIEAKKEGQGYVSTFIEHLQKKEGIIRFPNVINPKLAHLLVNRGFKKKREYIPFFKGHADVYVWKK